MNPVLIDGKHVAACVREELLAEIAALKSRGHVPGLAVVLVGNDPASQVYDYIVKSQSLKVAELESPATLRPCDFTTITVVNCTVLTA